MIAIATIHEERRIVDSLQTANANGRLAVEHED